MNKHIEETYITIATLRVGKKQFTFSLLNQLPRVDIFVYGYSDEKPNGYVGMISEYDMYTMWGYVRHNTDVILVCEHKNILHTQWLSVTFSNDDINTIINKFELKQLFIGV